MTFHKVIKEWNFSFLWLFFTSGETLVLLLQQLLHHICSVPLGLLCLSHEERHWTLTAYAKVEALLIKVVVYSSLLKNLHTRDKMALLLLTLHSFGVFRQCLHRLCVTFFVVVASTVLMRLLKCTTFWTGTPVKLRSAVNLQRMSIWSPTCKTKPPHHIHYTLLLLSLAPICLQIWWLQKSSSSLPSYLHYLQRIW